MRRRLVLGTSALLVLAASYAFAGTRAVPAGPLVAADGHGLAPRFASLADTTRVARRTAADDAADTLSHWGATEAGSEPAAEGSVVGRLARGAAAFWMGGYVADRVVTSQVPTDEACALTHCWSWRLVVLQPATRLRVGLDTPSRESSFTVEVIDAAGEVVGTATNSNRFDIEAFIPSPKAGTYTVRVVPRDAAWARFRLRAKAEDASATPVEAGTIEISARVQLAVEIER